MTLAKGIKALAQLGQYGHSRHPRNFYMGEGGCSYYWDNHGTFKTQSEWDRAVRLLNRYHRFCAFVEGWKSTGEKRYWADNSTEVREVSRQGKERWMVLVAPNGDAC